MHVLQELVIEEEVPLRHRHETRVRRIGLIGQREGDQGGERGKHDKYAKHDHRVHIDLTGIKGLAARSRLRLIPGAGRSNPPENKKMQHDSREDQRRQEEDMHRKEPGQRQGSQRLPAAQDLHEEVPDEGHRTSHIDPDLRGPVGGLIPGQEIAGERKHHHDQEQDHPHHPHELAWRLEGSIEKDLEHVQANRDDHCRRAPMVEAADEPAEGHLVFDVLHAVIGMIRRRSIVHGEEHAGDSLQHKQEERGRAEHIDPTGAARDRFIQQCAFDRLQFEPAIEPVVESGHSCPSSEK